MLLPATLAALPPMTLPPLMAPSTGAEGGNPLLSLLPMLLIFVIFYFLLIRPQQKQAKKHSEMLKNVKKGDRVITSGGVYGRVVGVGDNDLTLQIAKDVEVQLQKGAITSVVTTEDSKS
ncbi:MAG: preprotein translocase subunit YajC [Candidatus Eisenbacteria bacterium]|nr:preprotein translocase subunit YajC [Candidatus Eisenbacteria bacterium]